MRQINFLLIVLFIIFSNIGSAQNGIIRGTVVDSASAQPMPGVKLIVEGGLGGAISDLDGKFEISVPPGLHSLKISFMSYETLLLTDITVKSQEVTILDNIQMTESKNLLGEVEIKVERYVNTENSVLSLKQNSTNVIDGISSASFRKMGDSDAANAVQRVPGVSVSGGKYVYVRGLGDRYNKTTLNGTDIPGLDPDRNALQMDIFPTNVLDNIIVHKSFSADMPADFTGGIIDIGLKDFPEEKKGVLFFGGGYNPAYHFNSNYVTYDGGATDFLGFDNGNRDIPAINNIPFFAQVIGNPDGENGLRYREILGAFNPTMAAYRSRSFMDYSFGTSYGNQHKKSGYTIGYNFVFAYKNSTEFYQNAEYGRYGLSANPDIFQMEARERQIGDFGVNNVLLTGMAGFAIKTQNSKIRLNVLHLQNGESKAGIFNFYNSDQGAIFDGIQHNLDYSQRSLTNVLLHGKHDLENSDWKIEWKLSPTYSTINDPDIRFTRYEDRDGVYTISTESGFPERIWRELQEINGVGVLNFEREFNAFDRKANLKFGASYSYKQRDFVIRTFAINVRDMELTGDPDELFAPENIWPHNGNPSEGTTYEANFAPVNPNQFSSNAANTAGYVSVELKPTNKLRTIIGVRVENYVQRYTGQDQLGINVLSNDKVLNNLGIFPAANFVYALTDKQNLRMSYGKTIARPSFKELSYAEIYDPISGRTFIGGLFRDADDASGTVYWDGNLRSTDIHNFDLRWELFNGSNQTISAGVFYKMFFNPIEIVQFSAQAGSFQPRNVGDGQVIGAELEIRQSLKFISKKLEDFSFSTNITYTQSRIQMSETEYQSRVDNARTGQVVDRYRPMAGQAPYLINAGFSYNGGEKGFWKGFEAGLYYNVQGRTLEIVGVVDRPDIYMNSFHSLNFNANKTFGSKEQFQVGFKVDNIVNDDKESVFVSFQAADEYFTRLSPGRTFQFKFNYKF